MSFATKSGKKLDVTIQLFHRACAQAKIWILAIYFATLAVLFSTLSSFFCMELWLANLLGKGQI